MIQLVNIYKSGYSYRIVDPENAVDENLIGRVINKYLREQDELSEDELQMTRCRRIRDFVQIDPYKNLSGKKLFYFILTVLNEMSVGYTFKDDIEDLSEKSKISF